MTSDYAILVVDDEVPFTEIMAEILRSYGLQTKVAHSAREALGLMSDGVPQLLILDVMMPETDGLTLMGQVKSNTRWDGIPVVIASGCVLKPPSPRPAPSQSTRRAPPPPRPLQRPNPYPARRRLP